ncbi:Ubiquinol-cytochrome C reductase iron-sulfur subunit [hydrothermal vent metagenome]|uniref:Ubiquinol-cytochrome c reductase iron-sulfur subunit n=1 Tax=hydrothermal vent metagenome TaxID=652676 RepID=A0A3B0S390_9ZZZZ
MSTLVGNDGSDTEQPTRRDFIHIASAGFGLAGVAVYAWPLIDQMNPSADTMSLATIEVDISNLEVGQQLVAKWQGKPVFVRYRTDVEIAEADAVDVSSLRDKQTDDERLVPGPDGKLKPQYLVTVGICTHLGCVPLFDPNDERGGEYKGWFCPCHGSHYDNSGRIRKGPAPKNLVIPPYWYVSDNVLEIGKEASA